MVKSANKSLSELLDEASQITATLQNKNLPEVKATLQPLSAHIKKTQAEKNAFEFQNALKQAQVSQFPVGGIH